MDRSFTYIVQYSRLLNSSVVPGTDGAVVKKECIFAEDHVPFKAKLKPGFQW